MARMTKTTELGGTHGRWVGLVIALVLFIAPEAFGRVFVPELGRWTRRDPIGYVDGMGLYEYVRGSPIMVRDPSGLASRICQGQSCPGNPVYRIPIYPAPADPDDIVRRACEDYCSRGYKRAGGTFCVYGQPVACICDRGIDEFIGPLEPSDAVMDPWVSDSFRECTAAHEQIHIGDIDCSKCNGICGPDPTMGHQPLPWTPESGGGECSECRAWSDTLDCMSRVGCVDGNCITYRALMKTIKDIVEGHCRDCDVVRRFRPPPWIIT